VPAALVPKPAPMRITREITWKAALDQTRNRIPRLGVILLWMGAIFAGVFVMVAAGFVAAHLVAPAPPRAPDWWQGLLWGVWWALSFLIDWIGPLAIAMGGDVLVMHGRRRRLQRASRVGLWATTAWSAVFIVGLVGALVQAHH